MSDNANVIDQSSPSIARVYDYLLGGKDNYEVDRAIGDHFKLNLPGSVAIAFTNRQALTRAVREMAEAGLTQFLDFGSGLPTADNVHQVAQRVNPDTRVVYVDNDPIVLAHGRALLATNDNTTVVHADVRDSVGIRANEEVNRLIDFDKPVGLIFSAILHHLNDDEDPRAVVEYWTGQIPVGSSVFISHFRSGDNAETIEAEAKLQSTFGRGRWRTDAEIVALFGDLRLREPGVAAAARWHQDVPTDDNDSARIGSPDRELSVWEELIVAAIADKV
ncbi:SAM-dependent methyltransferase [Nocardia sp. MH4]|uniref:SAM-dependent methyltransferase n=1 Tax=Nocardia TaxID=1817 RepID=UPI001C4FEEFE|nr:MULTISPECIES: SAM-dependent methyltransferase [Nocardia]MBW0271627.1 SAM-dependent methyltransferase [Nocardia sp. MH4]